MLNLNAKKLICLCIKHKILKQLFEVSKSINNLDVMKLKPNHKLIKKIGLHIYIYIYESFFKHNESNKIYFVYILHL